MTDPRAAEIPSGTEVDTARLRTPVFEKAI
jgi:hypothetical protein